MTETSVTANAVAAPSPGANDTPWEPPLAGTETEHIVGALERLRATFRWKADGLNAEQLRIGIGVSALTIGRVLKHLAFDEDYMFTTKLRGDSPGEPWDSISG